MNKQDIIAQLAQDKEYLRICRNISQQDDRYKDLYQELFLALLEYDATKLEHIYEQGYLKRFILRILTNMWHSKTSAFYMKYRHNDITKDIDNIRYPASEEYDHETDVQIGRMHSEIEALPWYDGKLFCAYVHEGSIRKLARKTGIEPRSIGHTVKKVRETLRKRLEPTR